MRAGNAERRIGRPVFVTPRSRAVRAAAALRASCAMAVASAPHRAGPRTEPRPPGCGRRYGSAVAIVLSGAPSSKLPSPAPDKTAAPAGLRPRAAAARHRRSPAGPSDRTRMALPARRYMMM